MVGRPDQLLPSEAERKPVFIDMWTRCRRCNNCLKMRRRLWTARGFAEYGRSTRTWFGTLTLSAENQYLYIAKANSTEPLARHREIGVEVTKYLKRLRKEARTSFRYLCVMEVKANGTDASHLHYHLLIHEQSQDGKIKHRTLKTQWKLGFVNWKLVETKQVAGYVAKYLGKSALARVRASKGYGDPERAEGVIAQSRPNDIGVRYKNWEMKMTSCSVEDGVHAVIKLDPPPLTNSENGEGVRTKET